MKKLLAFVATIFAVAALSVSTSLPAQAVVGDWPQSDKFLVGDAQWQFDEYGLMYGWDQADLWNSDGYVYYPNEYRFAPDQTPGDTDDYYFLCGDPSTFRQQTVVTTEESGAISIKCPEVQVPDYPHLIAQLDFRIYPETETGYLIRQQITVTNDSATVVLIPDLQLFNYPHITADYSVAPYTGGADSWFEDSTGSSFALADGASWYSQGMLDGTSVFLTNAWAVTGGGVESMYLPIDGFDDPYAGASQRMKTTTPNAFAANTQTHLLTFSNMFLPYDATSLSAITAQSMAQAQTEEFDTFSGRLIEDLPSCTAYAGWGITPGSCDTANSNTQPCIAVLAETGLNIFVTFVGALSAAAIGLWLMYHRKRAVRRTRTQTAPSEL